MANIGTNKTTIVFKTIHLPGGPMVTAELADPDPGLFDEERLIGVGQTPIQALYDLSRLLSEEELWAYHEAKEKG